MLDLTDNQNLKMKSSNSTLKPFCIFTVTDNAYSMIFSKCIESIQLYAKKHSVQFCVLRLNSGSPSAIAWIKIKHTLSLLNNGYGAACFVDADCFINDHAPNIFDEFLETSSVACSLGKSGRLNSGFYVMRNDYENIQRLQYMLDNCEDCTNLPPNAPYENGHFINAFSNHQSLQMLDGRLWNNNSEISKSCYLQHYSGGILRQIYISRFKESHPIRYLRVRLSNRVGSALNLITKKKIGLKDEINQLYKKAHLEYS